MSILSGIENFRPAAANALAGLARKNRSRTDAPWTATTPMILGLWLGLAVGLLELGALHTRSHFLGWSSLSALQISRHFTWMIPIADLVLFLGLGVVLGLLRRVLPLIGARQSVLLLSFPAFLALLLMFPGLYHFARVAVAGAFSTMTARWALSFSRSFLGFLRKSLPMLLVSWALLPVWKMSHHTLHELVTPTAKSLPPAGAKNVLLVVMDTVRADRLSLQGYGRRTTPNLQRLASKAIRFDQARSTAPWTLPSHASMFSGLWPHQLAVGEDRPLDEDHPTLAEYLSAQGYLTAGFVGNTYFCNSWYGLGRGFDHYEDFYDEDSVVSVAETLRCSALGRCLGDLAKLPLGADRRRKDAAQINRDFLDWLSEQEQGLPFFAFLNFFDAHSPYLLPKGVKQQFGRARTVADHAVIEDWDNRPKHNIPDHEKALVSDAYDDCIAYLDAQIGKLIEELDKRGVLENTLIIITSDHGEELGEHGLYGHGRSLYSQELHVPLLIVDPGRGEEGRVIAEPVSLRDLPATVVDLVGVRRDSPFPGNSLARYWKPDVLHRDSSSAVVLSEVALRAKVSRNPNRAPAWRGPMKSLVAQGKSYIRNADGGEELYDILSDPADSHNLINSIDCSDSLTRLRETMKLVEARQQ